MKRYKRGLVNIFGHLLELNLYKNDEGFVFISFEGEWVEVEKNCEEYWEIKK